MDLVTLLVCIAAGIGAGVSTGLAGLSAVVVIAPMLHIFLKVDAYTAIGIGLASDVLASGFSAYYYGKNKHLDIKSGIYILITTVIFTIVGSYLGSIMPPDLLGDFSLYMTVILGLRFIFFPIMKGSTKAEMQSQKTKTIKSLLSGVIVGLICGFFGAGGGLMLLIVLTGFLGYELKTAVGTSVFIMTFTAFTGAFSHVLLGDKPDIKILLICIASTLAAAVLTSKLANKAEPKILNRVTGIVLTGLGIAMIIVNAVQ